MPLFDHYLSLAAFAYILSALFFAAVRWFHVCQPYQKQVDYYFPGRRVVVFFNLLTLITFPYVLWPSSPDAWLLVKSYFPLTQFDEKLDKMETPGYHYCAAVGYHVDGAVFQCAVRGLSLGRKGTPLSVGSLYCAWPLRIGIHLPLPQASDDVAQAAERE